MNTFTVTCDACQDDELERLVCDKCYGVGKIAMREPKLPAWKEVLIAFAGLGLLFLAWLAFYFLG
jgi:hypothetical protein